VVLTSKHHDGYCLWPNKEASISFNREWNSVESGPHRDLVGDLAKAVRYKGLKMGCYYSLWDWYNTYWTPQQQMAVVKGKKIVYENGERKEIAADEAFIKASEAALDKYIHEVMYPHLSSCRTGFWGLEIDISSIGINDLVCSYLYTFRITGVEQK